MIAGPAQPSAVQCKVQTSADQCRLVQTRPAQCECSSVQSAQFLSYIPFIVIAVIVTMTTIIIIVIVMTMTTTIVTMHILEAMITAIYGIAVGRRWPRGNMCRVIILSRRAPGILVVSALCAMYSCVYL